MNAIDYLKSLDACRAAVEWAASRPKARRTLAALWADCPRGDWMLWLAGRVPRPDLAGIVAAAHACAMLAHDYAYAAAAAADAYADAAYAACRTYAAYADADAAYAATTAADAAAAPGAGTAAREIAHRQCADLVRMLVRRPKVKGVR